MLEIMIWGSAYPRDLFKFPWDIANLVSSGKRTPIVENVKNGEMKRLITSCWNQLPQNRFSINDIVPLLETMLMKMK